MPIPLKLCPCCGGSGMYDRYVSEFDLVEIQCHECEGSGEVEDNGN